jgi:hypothetical protein
MRDKELRRYKTRPSVAAKSTAFSLSEVEKVTEAVEQPAVEDGEGSPVAFAGSTFITRFDLKMKVWGRTEGVARVGWGGVVLSPATLPLPLPLPW